ncbi:unnamed protein product [Caenorhabditis brenneri]
MIKFLFMPYLVQKAVLERMGLLELFDFTRLSKRMRNKVKNDVWIRKVELAVFIDNDVTFYFTTTEDGASVCTFNVEPLSELPPLEDRPELIDRNIGGELNSVASALWETGDGGPWMSFHLNDYLQGARALYKELVEIFSVPAIRGTLNLELAGNDYRPAVNLFNEFGPRWILVEGENVDFEAYMWTLEHLSSSKQLGYEVKPTEYLELGMPALDHEEVIIQHGFWVRPQHLEVLSALKSIEFEDSSFTGNEINEFLLRLKRGSYPNLESACFYLRGNFGDQVVLDGLNAIETDEFDYTVGFDNGDSCEFAFTVDESGQGIEIKIKRMKNENQQK